MGRTRLTSIVVAVAVTLLGAACGPSSPSGGATRSTVAPGGAPVVGSVTVSVAASLRGAFTVLRDEFTRIHPGAAVRLNAGSSGQLERQIESGAPVDLAAFADEVTMQRLADGALLAGPARIFATNSLVIVTKPRNPAGVRTLRDFAGAGVVSLCAPTAPCGTYAHDVLTRAGVNIAASQVSLGQDVEATLTSVVDGDAVAGIVYATDAERVGAKVATIAIPQADNAIVKYPIAVLRGPGSAAVAEAFLRFVLGARGRAVFAGAGFGPP